MQVIETATIISQTEISACIFDLRLLAPDIAEEALPGQFVNVYLNDESRLLPRPISLCGFDPAAGEIRLVYRVNGEGTREMALMKSGETLRLIGPLGNGFPLEEAAGKNVCLVGGGIGVPPLLETAKALKHAVKLDWTEEEIVDAETENISTDAQITGRNPMPKTVTTTVTSVMGYRSDMFLADEFRAQGTFFAATEDGSAGVKGTVIDALEANQVAPDVMFACGPLPMLRALKKYAAEREIPLWVSMEERMACGIGACLGCVCRTTEVDSHSHVKNARVCKDGPVFAAEDVEL